MHHCDLTGISCEGRELFKIPGNPALWVAPSVKVLLMRGLSLQEVYDHIKEFEARIDSMTSEERKVYFDGSKQEIY